MIASKLRSPLPLEAITLGLVGVLYGPLLWHWADGWLNKSISIQPNTLATGCWAFRSPPTWYGSGDRSGMPYLRALTGLPCHC